MISLPFRDRDDAARQLAAGLAKFAGSRPLILAIPRGAVPMGRIIADALGGQLDVVLVRKIGAPGHAEFAVGAIDEQGDIFLNENAAWVGAGEIYVQRIAQIELALIRQRRASYRPGKQPIALEGRTVIVVDDGLATGSTMIAALKAVRSQHPAYLVCAVPVAAEDSLAEVAKFADEVVCLATPKPFHAVGRYYLDFSSVSDEEVVDLLAPSASRGRRSSPTSIDQVRIPAGQIELEGDLTFPASAFGLVIFAHGSGSGRHSSRNRYVANILNQRRMVTLLFDLLTDDEDRARATRFDIPLLARRLDAAVQWAQREPSVRSLPIGLFGASTGAAAAIIVAAAREQGIAAVVSRGGRPDLAGAQALSMVRSHTLLIVGGADTEVLALNRTSQSTMGRRAELQVIPGATHLFEEPGTLEQAANAAADWFTSWLQPAPRVASSMRTRGC